MGNSHCNSFLLPEKKTQHYIFSVNEEILHLSSINVSKVLPGLFKILYSQILFSPEISEFQITSLNFHIWAPKNKVYSLLKAYLEITLIIRVAYFSTILYFS